MEYSSDEELRLEQLMRECSKKNKKKNKILEECDEEVNENIKEERDKEERDKEERDNIKNDIKKEIENEYEEERGISKKHALKTERIKAENSKLKRDIIQLEKKNADLIMGINGGDDIKTLKKEIYLLKKERDIYINKFTETDRLNDRLYKRIGEQERQLFNVGKVEELQKKIRSQKEDIKNKMDTIRELEQLVKEVDHIKYPDIEKISSKPAETKKKKIIDDIPWAEI